jgi:hypothetical protein
MIDWNNPEQRAALTIEVGSERYDQLFEQHRRDSVIARCAGYAIRPWRTRFGVVYAIDGGEAVGFATLAEAEAWCTANPRTE